MHLFAALVPPPDVLERVRELVAGVPPIAKQPATVGRPGRHRLGRRSMNGEPAAPPGPQLDVLPGPAMHLPIAKFGHLPLSEAARLADALDQQVSGWASPRLHLAGGMALEPEGDDSVWMKVEGDLDALGEIARGVPRVAQNLQLFVDRRRFRSHMQVATINSSTTEAYLEQVLAALQEFESPSWWQTTVSLLVPIAPGPGQAPFKTFRDLPLGPAVPH